MKQAQPLVSLPILGSAPSSALTPKNTMLPATKKAAESIGHHGRQPTVSTPAWTLFGF